MTRKGFWRMPLYYGEDEGFLCEDSGSHLIDVHALSASLSTVTA